MLPNKSFPLFKLPLVVLRQTCVNWIPIDILILSNASKRTAALLHSIVHKKRFKIKIGFWMNARAFIQDGKDEHVIDIPYEQNSQIDIEKPPLNFVFECVSIYNIIWKFDRISFVLNTDVYCVSINANHCFGNVSIILYWLNYRQRSVDDVVIDYDVLNVDDLYLLINSLKINKNLIITIRSKSHSVKLLNPKFEVDTFWMRGENSNSWMTLDDIINFNCVHIDLASFSFTSSDMNRYLKAWINGCNPRMEYLKLGVQPLDHKVLIEGIEVEEIDASVVKSYDSQVLYINCAFKGGTNIRRTDGKVATFQQIIYNEGLDSDQRFPFRMVVWPGGTQ